MKWFDVPLVGRRPVEEFEYGGPIRRAPDSACSDSTWAEHVFFRDGLPGRRREWWYHRPSAAWYVVERDSGSDLVHSVGPPAARGEEVA
jgi:sarcosine oxidase subunit delta